VGCGEVVQIMHLPSLRYLADRFEVTAVCDLSAHVADAVAAEWGVGRRCADHLELASLPDVDVVLVANPDVYHSESVLAAIEAGKHVLVEKPMCLTLREADEIAAAQRRARVIVQVGYMRRHAQAFLQARELIAGLGPIRLARAHDLVGLNAMIVARTSRVVRGDDVAAAALEERQEREDALVWEAIGDSDPELGAAYRLLLNLASHSVSALRELIGMPQGVLYAARPGGQGPICAAFDYGSYVCQFEAGFDGIARFDSFVEVYGEERVVRVDFDTPYVRNLPIRLRVTESNGQGGVVERHEHPLWGDPFVSEWESFHDCILHGKEPKTSPADFRHDLELFVEIVGRLRGGGHRVVV